MNFWTIVKSHPSAYPQRSQILSYLQIKKKKKTEKMYNDCIMLSMRFPQKLWKIVNDCKTGAIKWSLNGGTILLDYKKFQEEYLSAKNPIFKTNNITSFIRQLNLYGFRKVTSHNRDPICNSNNPDIHEFLHENFRSGRSDLLVKVCRKAGNKLRSLDRANLSNRIIDNNNKEEHKICHSPETEFQRMSRLQLCQYALTRALAQARRDFRREKMIQEAMQDEEAMMELVNLESEDSGIWERRYKLMPLLRNS